MQLSAKAHFADAAANNTKILIRSGDTIPREWLIEYRKAARGEVPGVIATPRKTGALRRNIITQQLGNRAQVSWRLPYAVHQNRGYHSQYRSVSGINHRDGGYGTIKGGVTYFYRQYTTPGTGKGFAKAAYVHANSQLPQIARKSGLIK